MFEQPFLLGISDRLLAEGFRAKSARSCLVAAFAVLQSRRALP